MAHRRSIWPSPTRRIARPEPYWTAASRAAAERWISRGSTTTRGCGPAPLLAPASGHRELVRAGREDLGTGRDQHLRASGFRVAGPAHLHAARAREPRRRVRARCARGRELPRPEAHRPAPALSALAPARTVGNWRDASVTVHKWRVGDLAMLAGEPVAIAGFIDHGETPRVDAARVGNPSRGVRRCARAVNPDQDLRICVTSPA